MASHISREIRESKESGVYDLKGFTQEQCVQFVSSTFADPLELSEMVKVTLIVGAGKLARQKYDDNLSKWLCSALKDLGYVDDRGASATMECAGSFKFQHDTDKNEKFVHVFPRVKQVEGEGQEESGEGSEKAGLKVTAEWLCIASEMGTFKDMVQAKMPAWIEKRRCVKMLKDTLEKIGEAEGKLAKMESLDQEEERLIEQADRDLIEQKIKFLTQEMKKMVDKGALTKKEKDIGIEMVNSKLDKIKEEVEAEKSDKKDKRMEKLEAALNAAMERKKKLEEIEPIKHELANVKEMKKIWRALQPMNALLEKAGPKGRWSSKLTPEEATKLGEKDELEETLDGLLVASRHWFEEVDEFSLRVEDAKKTVPPPAKKKPSAAKPVNDGWSTVASGKKKKPGMAGAGKPAPKSYNTKFGALMD